MTRIAVVLIAIALAAPLSAQKPAAASAAALQGTWIFESINGEAPGEGAPEMTLTFSGKNYHQTVGAEVNERGTFTVDVSRKPMTIDLTIVEGADAGKSQPGIFELSGDTLRANFALPGGTTRPADMKPSEGSLLLVAKRKKA